MFTGSNLLSKILNAAAHDNVNCLFVGFCSHDWIRGSGFL
jgi:hypothetical protein